MTQANAPDPDDYDPFAAFDDVIGGTTPNPYPEFAERRRHEPVWFGTLLNTDVLPEGLDSPRDCVVFRYEDCARILRDPKTFTSTGYNDTIGQVMGRTMLGMDDPEHRANRNLVAPVFRERALVRWEAESIAPVVDECIDRFAARGNADLVAELTFEFPVRVIARILGLPEGDFAQFRRWVVELIALGVTIERGLNASESLRQYFAGIVAARRVEPRDDLISDLVTAEVDGERLGDDDIYAFLRLLLPAGAETTYRSTGSLLFLLLSNPEQLDAVRDDRSLLPQAIEEALRCEPPLAMISRTATKDVEIAGVEVPAGTGVNPCLASANHDETRWEDPDTFDLFRPPLPHLAFAQGPHMCLGMHLARLETRLAVNGVLDRLHAIRFDPDAAHPYIQGKALRSPTALPVRFALA
jgi:cytochrome P450